MRAVLGLGRGLGRTFEIVLGFILSVLIGVPLAALLAALVGRTGELAVHVRGFGKSVFITVHAE